LIKSNTAKPTRPANREGTKVVNVHSLELRPFILSGNQKVTSVGRVPAVAPRQMDKPAITGDSPVSTQAGPAIAAAASIAAVPEPTAARIAKARIKPSKMIGI